MGTGDSLEANRAWNMLKLPRTHDGGIDSRETLDRLRSGAPAFIALWGLLWLTTHGVGIRRLDLSIALLSAIPIWVMARAWRLPWWLQAGAASLPLSVAAIALAHGDAAGLVRATKLGYGAFLFLGTTAWVSGSSRRRTALGVGVAVVVACGFLLSWSSWIALADGPWTVMRGTLDWHNQFAIHMVFGFVIATFLVVLGSGKWPWVTGVCAVLSGTGVIMSGSRFGFALAACGVVAALACAIAVTASLKTVRPAVNWLLVAVGALLLPVLLRSPLFFPASGGSINPLETMTQRGGFDYSATTRWAWWQAAWEMGVQHPLVGVGLLRYDEWTVCLGVRMKWHPHNEWLYGWAEGGLVGLLPLLALAAGVIALATLSVRPRPDARRLMEDPVRWAAVVACVLGVADLVIEYDPFYPLLVGLLALTGGVGAGALAATSTSRTVSPLQVGAASLLALSLTAAVLGLFLDPAAETFPWMFRTAVDCSPSAP